MRLELISRWWWRNRHDSEATNSVSDAKCDGFILLYDDITMVLNDSGMVQCLMMLGCYWDEFGVFVWSFWDAVGMCLGCYWDVCWMLFGLGWDDFGMMLGVIWG